MMRVLGNRRRLQLLDVQCCAFSRSAQMILRDMCSGSSFWGQHLRSLVVVHTDLKSVFKTAGAAEAATYRLPPNLCTLDVHSVFRAMTDEEIITMMNVNPQLRELTLPICPRILQLFSVSDFDPLSTRLRIHLA